MNTRSQLVTVRRLQPPAIQVAPGTLEALKWLGLVLMTLDHVNKYLLGGSVTWLFAAGRLALPLVCFVLAFNLARPQSLVRGAYRRTALRLLAFGAVASIPFIGLGGLGWGWWPLHILFTLFIATSCAWLLDQGGRARTGACAALFCLGGLFVEFWWPALGACLCAWAYCRRPSWAVLVLWVACVFALYVINRNHWALASFALVFAAPHFTLTLPRMKHLFYWYYPSHLVVIWGVQMLVPLLGIEGSLPVTSS